MVMTARPPPLLNVIDGRPATGKTSSEEPTQSIRSARAASDSASAIAAAGNISPNRTTSGFTYPPHLEQIAAPSSPNSRSTSSIGTSAPQPWQLAVRIEPCTSITRSDPAFVCNVSMFWVINPSSNPRRSSSASARWAPLGCLSPSICSLSL